MNSDLFLLLGWLGWQGTMYWKFLQFCKSIILFMISLKYFHGQNWNIDIIKVRKLFALKRTCWGQNRLKHTQSIVREKGEERRENSFVAVFWYSNHAVSVSASCPGKIDTNSRNFDTVKWHGWCESFNIYCHWTLNENPLLDHYHFDISQGLL